MIDNEHKAFALAVVALARKHGMTGLNMTFHYDFPRGAWNSDIVRLGWASGRHGAPCKIALESTEHAHLEEPAP